MNFVKLSFEHIGEFMLVGGIPIMRGGTSLGGSEMDGGIDKKGNGHLEFTLEKVIVDIERAPFAVEVGLEIFRMRTTKRANGNRRGS